VKSRRSFRFSPILFCAALVLAETASAQFTWNPTPVNGNWNNPDNWQQWPLIEGPNTALTFGASTVTNLNLDIAGSFQLGSLTFTNAAPSLTLDTNTNSGLQFSGPNSTSVANLVMNTNSDVTLALPVSLLNSLRISGTGTGNLIFSETFFAGVDEELIMESAGTLTFAGTVNSLAASLRVNAGTISVTNGVTFISSRESSSYQAYIGELAGSTGAINVGGGAGTSTWNNTNSAIVAGFSGTGTLSITGGGVVTGGSGSIGEWGTATGTVNVGGGAGSSSWTSTGNLLVGNRGQGTLSIMGGGSVSNAIGIIANDGTGKGSATVGGGTGTSTWTNTGHLVVAQDGEGSLTITGGGSVTNTTGYIGYGSGSTGEVNVGGGNGASSWSSSGDLYVATNGGGTLTITGGGTVSNALGYIAEKGGSIGEVFVGGGIGTSTWTNNGLLYVGAVGDGSLNITGGGVVSSVGGIIGDSDGGSGSVTVDGGTGSASWNNSGHLVVGQWGEGELNITGGGTVTNTMGFIAYDNGSEGTVNIGGGAGTSEWINSGSLSVGYSGVAALNINSGGLVQAASLDDGNAQSSVNFNGGTLRITASDSASNRISLGTGGGTIDSSMASGSAFTLTGPISGDGRLTKIGTGMLALSGSNNSYSGGTTVSQGRLRINASGAAGTGGIRVETGGTLDVGIVNFSNAVTLAGGIYSRDFNISTNLAGRFTATSDFAGGTGDTTASILAGTTTNQFATSLQARFVPSLSATNDHLRNSDVFQIYGNALQGQTTIPIALQLSIAANDPGAYLGWLNSSNEWEHASGANTVNSSFADGPAYEGSFQQFQSENGTSLNSYIGAWGTYTENGTTHSWAVVNQGGYYAMVPEPSAALLAGIGVGGFVMIRRRRDRSGS